MAIKWSSLLKGSKIKTRSFIYVAPLFFIPFLFLGIYFFSSLERQKALDFEVSEFQRKSNFLVKNQVQWEEYFKEYSGSNPDFLKTSVSMERPLKEDVRILSEIEKGEKEKTYRPILERIEFLKGEKNQIHFIPKEKRAFRLFDETDWVFTHPVELSMGDLKKILSMIEGEQKERPQMFIKKLDLVVKDKESKHREFSLDLEVIQRGFHAGD